MPAGTVETDVIYQGQYHHGIRTSQMQRRTVLKMVVVEGGPPVVKVLVIVVVEGGPPVVTVLVTVVVEGGPPSVTVLITVVVDGGPP